MSAEHNQVIQALRAGDLIGYYQQSESYVYEVIKVEHQHLMAARHPKLHLRVIALKDIMPPF